MEQGRTEREKLTVRFMIDIYCHAHHAGYPGTCEECLRLFAYASRKIDMCPHHQAKPVCSVCAIHCYGREQRDLIRTVMRFSGPRMLLRHPVLALLHLADRARRPSDPVTPGRTRGYS